MEDILDSKDDENLINLFRLKNRVYNKTFKNYREAAIFYSLNAYEIYKMAQQNENGWKFYE